MLEIMLATVLMGGLLALIYSVLGNNAKSVSAKNIGVQLAPTIDALIQSKPDVMSAISIACPSSDSGATALSLGLSSGYQGALTAEGFNLCDATVTVTLLGDATPFKAAAQTDSNPDMM
jgi:hypothetical protein